MWRHQRASALWAVPYSAMHMQDGAKAQNVNRTTTEPHENPRLDIPLRLPYNTPIGNDGKKYPAMDA